MIGKEKKGSTLAELCVVLALISIVSLSVVSFTTMVSAHTTVSATRLKMTEDRQLAKVVLENWLNRMIAAGADIGVNGNGDSISASVNNETYTVLLEKDRITATVPDGDPLIVPISTLTSLTFVHMENVNGGVIYFCTATYELPDLAGDTVQRSFTFTLNPHIGDVY